MFINYVYFCGKMEIINYRVVLILIPVSGNAADISIGIGKYESLCTDPKLGLGLENGILLCPRLLC